MHLRSNRNYVLAADNNDSYGIYTTAKATHTRVTSFDVAQNAFEHLLQISMTGTYAAYTDHLLNSRRTFDAIFVQYLLTIFTLWFLSTDCPKVSDT